METAGDRLLRLTHALLAVDCVDERSRVKISISRRRNFIVKKYSGSDRGLLHRSYNSLIFGIAKNSAERCHQMSIRQCVTTGTNADVKKI